MKTLSVTAILIAGVLSGCAAQENESAQSTDEIADTVPLPKVDVDALLTNLQAFSTGYPERAANTAAHVGAREFLVRQYEAAGLDVWRQGFVNGIPQENIVGIKWGEDRSSWVVVGGHYDMTSKECGLLGQCVLRPYSEGAYDDGSGTIMITEMAKAWANVTTHHTIAFVNFDGEERGLQGSKAFSEAFLEGDHPFGDVTIRAMLNLDMFGINFPGTMAPVYMDVNSPELQQAAADAWADMGHPEEMIEYHGIRLGRSDYHWFVEQGIPTAFFISSFEKWELPYDSGILIESTETGTAADSYSAYPFWHLEDTWETMVAMAGSEEDLVAGFEAATQLAMSTLERMVADAALGVQG